MKEERYQRHIEREKMSEQETQRERIIVILDLEPEQ